nr:hypothetical protein [Tanacetum cinerariifolium]
VVLSSMESLKRMLHVTNILSAGSLTSQQMVFNSPCLTHTKIWLVQIKRSLAYFTAVSSKVSAVWSDKIGAAHLVLLGHQFWTTVAVKKVNDVTRLQALVDKKKVGDLSTHTTKYTSPALTQKVFANMRRVGVPAAGIIIEGVVSAADDVVPTADEEPSIPSPTPLTPPPQPSHDIPSTS